MTSSSGLRSAYTEAGVDVADGERVVELLREKLGRRRAGWPEVLGGLGGFGAAVAIPPGYDSPVLVSGADDVGTKTEIARLLRRYDTIGQDLVAMCADDVVCLGARPMFFLDYVAVGHLEPEVVAELVAGIGSACEVAGCALVGGETAEHPGLMAPDQFDLAGFCVGIAERSDLLDGSAVQAGDVLVGIASSGLHSNGFSLVRSLVERDELGLETPYAEVVRGVLGEDESKRVAAEESAASEQTLGEVLLTPTRIYAAEVLAFREALAAEGHRLRGLAHITGGGLPGNVPRALPESLAVWVDSTAWPVPSVFRLIGRLAGLDGPQLRATFNAGLGMIAIVPRRAAALAIELLAGRGLPAWIVGEVIERDAADGARYIENGVQRA